MSATAAEKNLKLQEQDLKMRFQELLALLLQEKAALQGALDECAAQRDGAKRSAARA